MSKTRIGQLEAMVKRLARERQAHVDAVAEIDAAFEGLGLAAGEPAKRKRKVGRPKKKAGAAKKRAKRAKGKTGKRYSVPGPESIVRFVRAAPKTGRTGGEIDKHWKKEGRAGGAYNLLGQLVKAGKLKRTKVKGGRGSVYRVA